MNIAVTGLSATDNPAPGIPVIRSLREEKNFSGKITGLIYDSLEPGIYMDDLVDNYYLIPYPSSGLENLMERISYIHQKENLDLLIPTLDSELYGFVKLQPRLQAFGIRSFLPTLEQLNIRGKDKLFDFCKANNINVPKNILIHSQKELDTIERQFKFPVVVKGIFYEAYIAHNFEEALAFFYKLKAKWGYPVIIQEYLKGDEFNVVALGDGEGGTTGAVAMRKLYITDKGKGWAGITIKEKTLLDLAHQIIEITKWRSGLELEFMKSKETGKFYLLEINPRLPAWVYLAQQAGQNLPAALVKLAYGKKVKPFTTYEIGKIFVRCSWDLITDIKKFETIATVGEW